jgi:AraC-like DNA-binding protein
MCSRSAEAVLSTVRLGLPSGSLEADNGEVPDVGSVQTDPGDISRIGAAKFRGQSHHGLDPDRAVRRVRRPAAEVAPHQQGTELIVPGCVPGEPQCLTEYVKRLRMARARELLLTTDRSIADIAGEVGYPDQFYFSRQFRAVAGSSPRHFRRRVAEEASL